MMDNSEFIQDFIVEESHSLLEHGHHLAAVTLMAQSVEFLGAFLDNKPLGARQQSKIRFRNAIYHLFPPRYAQCNRKGRLYTQLRSGLSHMLIPSAHIVLTDVPQKHLSEIDNKLYLHPVSFQADLKLAAEKIQKRLNSGELRRKKMHAFNNPKSS